MTPGLSVGETLFIGDWESLAMMHLEIPPCDLQPVIPFELDLFEGNAFISLVFFKMRGMRLACGPRMLDLLFYPFREQRFLNVRTYVRHSGEPGIHFIKEWISNRLCVHLGPRLYSLPYRWGKHHLRLANNVVHAHVIDRATHASLRCTMKLAEPFAPCKSGTRDEFLFERYAAFNRHRRTSKMFRVAHLPWKQCRAEAILHDDSLLRTYFPWFPKTRLAGANYSPGARDVRMGWPLKIHNYSPGEAALARHVPSGSTWARPAQSSH